MHDRETTKLFLRCVCLFHYSRARPNCSRQVDLDSHGPHCGPHTTSRPPHENLRTDTFREARASLLLLQSEAAQPHRELIGWFNLRRPDLGTNQAPLPHSRFLQGDMDPMLNSFQPFSFLFACDL